MPLPVATRPSQDLSLGVPPRLWLYTNYDCNLACTYCVAESHPHAERRGLPLETARRVIDEAVDLGFTELFITGVEPHGTVVMPPPRAAGSSAGVPVVSGRPTAQVAPGR